MPLQLPPIGPEVRPNRQADTVMDQVAEQPVQASLAIELVKDDPHHLLSLFIGVEGQPTARLAHITDRGVIKQFAAAGLVQSPFMHPHVQEV